MDLYLHIGTDKTGTKTIQKFIYDNKLELASLGVAISEILHEYPIAREKIAYNFMDKKKLTGLHEKKLLEKFNIKNINEFEIYFKNFANKFYEEIDYLSTNFNKLIISTEALYNQLADKAKIQRLKDFLDKKFKKIYIICYFREQADYFSSLYQQGLKNILPSKTLPIDVDLKIKKEKKQVYNYLYRLSLWADIFGEKNLIPIVYHKNNSLNNFVRLLNLASNDIRFKNTQNLNQSELPIQSVLVYNLNIIFQNKLLPINDYNSLFKLFHTNSFFYDLKHYVYPNMDKLFLQIYEEYNNLNIKFAKKFLNIDKNPFNIKKSESTNKNDVIIDHARVFDLLIIFLKENKFNSKLFLENQNLFSEFFKKNY